MKRRESKGIVIKRIITLLMLLLWMAVIFGFSAQDGGQSGGLSRRAAYGIAEMGNHLFRLEQSEQELQEQAASMQFVIRKGAHMSEYALLAALVLMHLLCYERKPRHLLLAAWFVCVVFAATDECHQLFVPGRAGRLMDVGIDAGGSFLGAGIFSGIRKIIWKKRNPAIESG